MSATVEDGLVRELTARVSGQVLAPTDAGYDKARAVHNGLVDKRPALIVRCRTADDVVAGLALARRAGLEVSVRGGGHNVAGRAVTDGGVMIDLAEPEPVPRLIHAIDGTSFVNDPFEPAPLPDVPVEGSELLALDGAGPNLWAVGGGATSGPAPPPEGAVVRPPLAARLVGGAFEELSLSGASFGPADRLADVAAIPAGDEALAAVVPFVDRRSVNSKATVARIGPSGATATVRLPSSGSGRGAAARVACPAPNECWMVTWAGWIFHYSDGTLPPLDTEPAFEGTIDVYPKGP